MRMPCTRLLHGLDDAASPPVNWLWAIALIRRTSLRRTSIAGGTITKPNSDITGSCITITATRPISDSRSRPTAVISRLSTWRRRLAPVVSRARNSDECRSAKKPRFSLHQLVEHPPLVVGDDAIADARQDHGVAVGRHPLDR